jgi:pyruvate dehydrogenase E1 component beta subunit
MIKKVLKNFSTNPTVINCRDAIRQAMVEEMKRDSNVFLIGEEVGQYHGAYKVSKGMIDLFGPERVVDTPITENGFTGLAIGASNMGLRPICEFMTWNFALQSISHISNSCAKTFYMSAGEISSPIVFRGLNGPAASVAAQHSQCLASLLSNIPGLIVLAPYDADDCKGLLKSAIRDNNPVCFLENELMYSKEFTVGPDFWSEEFLIPIGQAKVETQGKHVTIVSYSRMVGECIKAAEELKKQGIEAEVINLRSIKPLDRKTIIESVKKTGRLVTVEDDYPQSGVGAEIVSTIMESPAFNWLDAPVERVTAWDVPLAYAKNLETATLPQVENIIKAVKNTLKGVKL